MTGIILYCKSSSFNNLLTNNILRDLHIKDISGIFSPPFFAFCIIVELLTLGAMIPYELVMHELAVFENVSGTLRLLQI